MLFLAAAAAYGQDCERVARVPQLVDAIDQAQTGFSQANRGLFQQSADEATALLDCLGEPLSKHMAARYHRIRALREFMNRDKDAQLASFGAAKALQPAYVFPEDVLPKLHPLRKDYDSVAIDLPRLESFPPPASGHIELDGRPVLDRPLDWPTIFQRFDDDGAVVRTAWVAPGLPLPEYPIAQPIVESEPDTDLIVEPVDSRPPIRGELLVVGGVALVGSVVTMVQAGKAREAYDDPATTGETALRHLKRETNGFGAASIGLGVTAVGATTTAFLGARW